MKKFLKYFSFLLVMLVVVTGCGEKKDNAKDENKKEPVDATKTLEAALLKMNDIESLSMKMKFNIGMEAEGTAISMIINVDGEVDSEQASHMKMSVSMMGFTQASEIYTLNNEGYTYTYTKDETLGWYYTKEPITEMPEEDGVATEEQIKEALAMFSSVKEVESDKEGYVKLVATVDSSKFTELMENQDAMDFAGLTGATEETQGTTEEVQVDSTTPTPEEENDLTITEDFEMVLYLKDGYVSIIEIDLSDLASASVEEGETATNMTMNMTIELDNFNKIEKITLPVEATENAVPADQVLGTDLEV